MKSRNHPAHAAALLAAAHLAEALRRLEDAAGDEQPPGPLVDLALQGDLAGWRWAAERIFTGLDSASIPDPALFRQLGKRLATV